MKNTLNPCGCDGGGGGIDITTSNVTYNGAAEICIPLNPGDNLTAILQAIDQIVCDIRDGLDVRYTKGEVDQILEDYANLTDLLSGGSVDIANKELVFTNDAGEVFRIDASAFLAQGTQLTYNDGLLALLDADGNVLSSISFEITSADLKTTLEVTGPLTVNWDGTVPTGGQTFRQKHGEDIQVMAYRDNGAVELNYTPTVAVTRDGSGAITQVEFADVFAGRIVII